MSKIKKMWNKIKFPFIYLFGMIYFIYWLLFIFDSEGEF